MDCPDHDRLLKLITEFNAYRASQEVQQRAAAIVVDAKMTHLNALRERLEQDRGIYMRQDVYNEKHDQLVNKIGTVEKRMAWLAGVGAMLALLAGTIGALIGHFLR